MALTRPNTARTFLELFLARGQFAAKVWCNGDWRHKSAIEHNADPAGPFAQTRSYISRQVVNAFLSSLASRQPSVFPRHRWTSCDLACHEVGLLLSVHNDLHDSYLAFLVSCGVKRARPFVPASGPSAAGALPDCPALQRQQGGCNGEDEDGDDDGDGSEDEVALQGDAEAVPDADWSSRPTETDWHTMNKQYRPGGYNFVVAAPVAELLMLRTCLEPFKHVLAAHLLLSGESWEKEQQAADISFRLGKAAAEPRQHRACIAAKGCLEAELLGMVSSRFFDGKHWKYLPAHKSTVNVQHLIFKILSPMGCAAQEHLFLPHEQFPTKLFFASRGHRPWRGVREDLANEKVHAR